MDTLDGIRAALPKGAQIEVEEELYLADADNVLGRLHGVAGDVGCAMLIGHNPGIQDLAILLVGSGDASLRERLMAKFPTGAAVALSFSGAWTALDASTARIDSFFTPRAPAP